TKSLSGWRCSAKTLCAKVSAQAFAAQSLQQLAQRYALSATPSVACRHQANTGRPHRGISGQERTSALCATKRQCRLQIITSVPCRQETHRMQADSPKQCHAGRLSREQTKSLA